MLDLNIFKEAMEYYDYPAVVTISLVDDDDINRGFRVFIDYFPNGGTCAKSIQMSTVEAERVIERFNKQR